MSSDALVDGHVPLRKAGGIRSYFSVGLINVLLMCIVFFFLFMAFNTTQNLTTSTFKSAGFFSLGSLYLCFSFTTLTIAGAFSSLVGARAGLWFGGIWYAVYVCMNIPAIIFADYAIFFLIPAAGLLGMGSAILWTSHGTFISQNSTEATMGLYSGIFFAVFMCGNVVGNLVASIAMNTLHLHVLPVFIFFGSIAILGVALFVLLWWQPLLGFILRRPVGTAREVEVAPISVRGILLRVVRTMKLFLVPKMLLLLPTLVFSGFSQSFYYGTFPERVGEGMGREWIGYLMALFSFMDMLGSFSLGKLSDMVGRYPILLAASCSGAAGLVCAYFSSSHRPYLYFISAILLGFSDSGYNTQIYAIVSTFLPTNLEAGFAFFRFCQSFSTGLMFFAKPIGFTAISAICLFMIIASVLVISLLHFFVESIEVKASPAESTEPGITTSDPTYLIQASES